jgi:hypothetical protein
MGFFLFLLLNAILYVRPTEVFPALADLPVYEASIGLCLVCSVPALRNLLSGRSLRQRPITVCVLGLLAAVALSHLSHLSFSRALDSVVAFSKVVLYYLLFLCHVTTVARLRTFLLWLSLFVITLTSIALLHYHGLIHVAAIQDAQREAAATEATEEADGPAAEDESKPRLCSVGIYNNPNDLSRILVVGIVICLYWVDERRLGFSRFLWLLPVGMLLYALGLTSSRGGFISLIVGLGVMFTTRFGWKWGAIAGAVGLPLLLLVFGGRQTELSTSEDTGQQRIKIWRDGQMLFRSAPVFGIGMDVYAEEVGYVAHNSYVHCYTELGCFGGTMFTGAFFCAFLGLRRLSAARAGISDPDLRRLCPYLFAAVAGYMAGMLSISRSYISPTYMFLALIESYMLVLSSTWKAPVLTLNGRLVRDVLLVSAAAVVVINVFVRLAAV